MEGLIKGLIDVALGHRNEDEESGQHSRNERSRSTWAQVVNEGNDADGEVGDRGHGNDRNRWNREEESRFGGGKLEDGDSRPSWRSQQAVDENYGPKDHYVHQGNQWSRKTVDENYGPNDHCVHQGNQRSRKTVDENYGPNDHCVHQGNQRSRKEENSDGWETVGQKAPKRPHKVQKEHWNQYKRHSDQQEYSDEVELGSNHEPSRDELADISLACNKLWELDLNRLVPGKDYQIDCGEGKRVSGRDDMAEGSLFSWVSEDALKRPTFSRFCSLLDNYNPDEGSKEVVTAEDREEQKAFVEEISRTAPIKYLHKYLSSNGIVSDNYQEFKRTLSSLWFDLYGRGGTSGSSLAFEHVFVGEIKHSGQDEVSGFHNWLQFYLEEAKGNVDYRGYIFPRRRGQTPDSETQLLTIQFEWNGVLKSVSSILIGVSPEFEIALYTLCFYMGGEENQVELGPYPINVKCYRLGNRIGSAFPVT